MDRVKDRDRRWALAIAAPSYGEISRKKSRSKAAVNKRSAF